MTTSTLTMLDRAADFLENLHRRIVNDNGAKAALKRAMSGEEAHIRKIYCFVLEDLERRGITSKWEQDNIWIPVACLFAYYLPKLDRDNPKLDCDKPGNFGHSTRALANATDSEGADRRFRALLDTSLEDLRSPLSSLVRLMKSKNIVINYPLLIADLRQWSHPDQYIQDKWARAFWGAPKLSEDKQKTTDDPTE